jgi:RNA polymerase sigma-70 factor (ECF subfamily)
MAAGDGNAVSMLVDRHGDRMFGLAHAILGERVDAEEACADAFVQAWRTADRFDPVRGTVMGWLAMMTRTRALDLLRSRKKRAAVAASVLDTTAESDVAGTPPETGPDRHTESVEARQLVVRAMAELPEAQRRVIELAYFGGLSQSEIAEQ